jgi:hypothetical protein
MVVNDEQELCTAYFIISAFDCTEENHERPNDTACLQAKNLTQELMNMKLQGIHN